MAKIETNSQQIIDYYKLSFYVSNLIKDNVVSQESLIIQQFDDRRRRKNVCEFSEKNIREATLLYQFFLCVSAFQIN
jgi:hypothetical protein